MRYTLTRHASENLIVRRIALDWVERALCLPDWSEADEVDSALEHRFKLIPEYGNRVLRVIVNVDPKPPRVVTAFFDRRLRGTL